MKDKKSTIKMYESPYVTIKVIKTACVFLVGSTEPYEEEEL